MRTPHNRHYRIPEKFDETAASFDYIGRYRSDSEIVQEICEKLYQGDYDLMLVALEDLAKRPKIDNITLYKIKCDVTVIHKLKGSRHGDRVQVS